jgi:hypothetical protein
MTVEGDDEFYTRRAQQELDLAASSDDPAIKAVHLDMAGRYATLRQRAAPPRPKLMPRFNPK